MSNFRPILSWIRINKQTLQRIQHTLTLLSKIYGLIFFAVVVSLSIPQLRSHVPLIVNAMGFPNAFQQVQPPFAFSLLSCVSAFVLFNFVKHGMFNRQIMLSVILALMSLSMLYLACVVVVFLDLSWQLHCAAVIIITILLCLHYFYASNLPFYIVNRSYGDVLLELFVLGVFVSAASSVVIMPVVG
ncbi:MAG: hypothetical protein F6K11_04210 [Leptolyngbya sp. SIO3F4]|nr:hypothetical protein [Leptolyngbya sp. SIO3F4]